MPVTTSLTQRLGLAHPIVQAPMAGGATTPELVAAVANAGALGSMGVSPLPPDEIERQVQRVRQLTARPFNVNLFVLDPATAGAAELARAQELLKPVRDALGLPTPTSVPAVFAEDWRAQVDVLVALAPPVASFTFGLLDAASVARLKAKGTIVIGTATHVAEARAWAANGADAVVAQGAEAGGHRGTFIGGFEGGMIGTMALVPQIVDAIEVPVIAAGGIMDGRGIAAALALGADAAQLGTAFLNCREAAIHPAYKNAIREARDTDSRPTRALSGRWARGVHNNFMRVMDRHEPELPSYPIPAGLAADIRAAAARRGDAQYMALWSGQGVAMLKHRAAEQGATELVAQLVAETRCVMEGRGRT